MGERLLREMLAEAAAFRRPAPSKSREREKEKMHREIKDALYWAEEAEPGGPIKVMSQTGRSVWS